MDFEAFYRDTSRRMARYAYGLTGDPAETQDLVQEAYAAPGGDGGACPATRIRRPGCAWW